MADANKSAEKSAGDEESSTQEKSVGQKTSDAKDSKPARSSKDSEDKKPRRSRNAGKVVAAGAAAIRSRIASIVWLVAVLCAVILAIGALVVALKMNQHNSIVKFFVETAHKLDFGTLKKFTGKGAATKNALVNQGIPAIIYLVVGRVLDRIIRP